MRQLRQDCGNFSVLVMELQQSCQQMKETDLVTPTLGSYQPGNPIGNVLSMVNVNPGGHYWDYSINTLSFSQVTAADLIIRYW